MMIGFNRLILLSFLLGEKIWRCNGFVVSNHLIPSTSTTVGGRSSCCLSMSSIEDDDDDLEVGKMRVSEIKAELKLRQVDFSDCFDKESLSKRLFDARCKGKADPTIIDQFNQQSVRCSFTKTNVQCVIYSNLEDNSTMKQFLTLTNKNTFLLYFFIITNIFLTLF